MHAPPRNGTLRAGALACLLLLAPVERGEAQHRLTRRYGSESGLLAPPVWALEQDSAGFLWIGAQAGLFRYDGAVMQRWAPHTLRNAVVSLAVSPAGLVVALDETGALYEVTQAGARSVEPPQGDIDRTLRMLAFDDSGRLWTTREGRVVYRAADARWHAVPRSALNQEWARLVRANPHGGVDVATDAGLWALDPSRAPAKVLAARSIVDVLPLGDRRLALTFLGGVIEVRGGVEREMLAQGGPMTPPGRAVALQQRGRTVWVAFDRYLVALRPGEAPEVLGPDDGIEGGGPMMVDGEGSLWMGSFAALFQFPEPETRIWNAQSGLPSQHTRFLTHRGSIIWVTTWQGAGFLRRRQDGWAAASVRGWLSQERICRDDRDRLWLSADRRVAELGETGELRPIIDSARLLGCASASGGVWLATTRGLFHVAAGDTSPRRIPDVPNAPGDVPVESVLHDRSGRVWIARAGEICHASSAVSFDSSPPRWACQPLGDTGPIRNLIELPSGALWAATMKAGVLAHEAGGWSPLPANDDLPTRAVFALVPARSGGIWMVGHGVVQRVLELPRPGRGWDVVEELRAWHGLPVIGGEDLIEDDDGTVWIATSLGVVQIPPAARFAASAPPRVRLVDGALGDEAIPASGRVELPPDRNSLELRFAALSFRDPSLVRHQIRLSPDEPWVDASGGPSFRWVGLPPGSYRAELRASLDGRTWSKEPAWIAFRVQPPWWRTPWALTLFALLGAVVIWAGYRARLAVVLRLERQRTRIAMDLHDDIGSGLGSIGILSGVIAADGATADARRHLARQIARTAEELGTSLSDIIWSLDPHTGTLQELVERLAEHGERLFAEQDTLFRTERPARWPEGTLPLQVRRNVLLIGLEALYNAARHARASQVVLQVRPHDRGWELAVLDDGVGLAGRAQDGARRHRGIASMRRRAAEIGGAIQITPRPAGGTVVVLHFRAGARGRRGIRLLPARRRARGGQPRPA